MSTGEILDIRQRYRWVVDETPTVAVYGDELPVRAAEPGRVVHREVYLGTVEIDGEKRRVFRLGSYGRIEGVTHGLALDGVRMLLPEGEQAKIDWNGPRFNTTHVDVPALPRRDIEDASRIRLKCTGPGGCRLLVGLPTGRVRAEGPARDEIALRAIDWVATLPKTDPQEPRIVWRFDNDCQSSDATIESLVVCLDQFTGPYGRDLAIERRRIAMAMACFDGEDE